MELLVDQNTTVEESAGFFTVILRSSLSRVASLSSLTDTVRVARQLLNACSRLAVRCEFDERDVDRATRPHRGCARLCCRMAGASHIRNFLPWSAQKRWKPNSVVVVTGAGSGIGKQVSLGYAARGCRLVLGDINKESLAPVVAECKKV